MPSTTFPRFRRRRGAVLALVSVTATATALLLAGCSAGSPAPAPAVAVEAAPSPSPALPLMAPPDGDPQWDCGQASALFGIAARTEWERENGVIDAAAYEARMAALVDAWRYAPFGNSPVTDAVRATSGAADAGVGPDDSVFQVAANDLRVACDAAGSLILTSALPGMGG